LFLQLRRFLELGGILVRTANGGGTLLCMSAGQGQDTGERKPPQKSAGTAAWPYRTDAVSDTIHRELGLQIPG
jgi:hypothetical protein